MEAKSRFGWLTKKLQGIRSSALISAQTHKDQKCELSARDDESPPYISDILQLYELSFVLHKLQ